MSKQSKREREMWTEYVRQMEERKQDKRVRRRRAKKEMEPSRQQQLEEALDDLTRKDPDERT